jgi:hypothetical protein
VPVNTTVTTGITQSRVGRHSNTMK